MTAPDRILRAAAESIAERGTAGVSMLDVAKAAGVSKALIHYHFADRTALLARLVDTLTVAVVDRESTALDGATGPSAVDALWGWVARELAIGDVRALVDLAAVPDEPVRAATQRSARRRREMAAHTIDHLFAALGLKPRVPVELMAEVTVATLDGLAVASVTDPARDTRVAFDVLWLALLSLAE